MIPEILPYAQFVAQFALIGAAGFAGYQLRLHWRERSESAAIHVLTSIQSPDFRSAYVRIWSLPLGASAETVRAGGKEMEDAANCVMMVFESLGVLVHNRIVALDLVDQVIGGFLRESWRRLEPYIRERRRDLASRRWAEWYEWLADQVGVDERRTQGAYVAFKDWKV